MAWITDTQYIVYVTLREDTSAVFSPFVTDSEFTFRDLFQVMGPEL